MSLDVYLTDNYEKVYSANITHNHKPMAEVLGIHELLWRCERHTIAASRIEPLTRAVIMAASARSASPSR